MANPSVPDDPALRDPAPGARAQPTEAAPKQADSAQGAGGTTALAIH